ncbi:MAG TPA: PAS domain S-box protein, partial [Thermodesulfobacteriota bacterium]|nr:PAS domain S-box protein [Thermodesulfobacteriota bacterium]
RQYLARILSERYRVEAVPDGSAALAAARERRPDLVLTDIMMPNLDGFGLLREFRADPVLRTVPIILLSARAGEESRIEGMQQGADDYLIKPFSARELLARVAAHMEMARMRKEAAEQLRESEERFRTLFENLNSAAVLVEPILDRDGRLVDLRYLLANPSLKKHIGIDRDAIVGKRYSEVFHYPGKNPVFDIYQRVLSTGEPFKGEVFFPGVNGYLDISVYRPAAGRLALVFSNITERKKAEESLRESRTKLEAALNSMTDALFICDSRGSFIDFNDAYAKYYRFKNKTEWVKNLTDLPKLIDVFLPDGTPAPLEAWPVSRALRGESGNSVEFTVRRKDTGETWVGSYSFAPVRGDDGAVLGSVVTARDITEQKQTERALRESEERFRFLAESIPNFVWSVAANGVTDYYNVKYLEYLGKTMEEAKEEPWTAKLHPDDRGRSAAAWRKAFRTGGEYLVEYRIRRADGEYRWHMAHAVPLRNSSGQIIRWYGTCTDMDDRRRDEEALRANEVRLNRSQEMAHLGSWELDLIQDRLSWSDEVYRIFGLEPQGFKPTYEAFLEAVHPDDRAAVGKAYSESVQSGKDSYEIEHRIVRRSTGEIRIVHEKCEHLRDASGRIIRSVGMIHDITDAKRAQSALQESEERYRGLFKTMQEAFTLFEVITDEAGNPIDLLYLSVNPALERRFKRSSDAIVGHTYREIVANPDLEWIALIGKVALTGEPVSLERYSRAFGKWVELHAYSPRKGQCAALTTDISERRKAEGALRRSRDELEIRVRERTAEIQKQAELIDLARDAIIL